MTNIKRAVSTTERFIKMALSGMIAASIFISSGAQAAGGVALGSTRVIYPLDANQVSLPISNSDTKDVFLIQSWVSEANGKKSADFVITPPLFVIQPGRENLLRIMYTGKKALPSDRESLYYLNSKSIPSGAPAPGKNTLQIATQNIIKLFVRPKNLPMKPGLAPGALRCQVTGNTLSVKNASPYYVTLVQLNVGTRTLPNTMVAPLSSATVNIQGGTAGGNKVTFKTINDFGATSAEQQCRA